MPFKIALRKTDIQFVYLILTNTNMKHGRDTYDCTQQEWCPLYIKTGFVHYSRCWSGTSLPEKTPVPFPLSLRLWTWNWNFSMKKTTETWCQSEDEPDPGRRLKYPRSTLQRRLSQGWVSDGQGHVLTRTAYLRVVLALYKNLDRMPGLQDGFGDHHCFLDPLFPVWAHWINLLVLLFTIFWLFDCLPEMAKPGLEGLPGLRLWP